MYPAVAGPEICVQVPVIPTTGSPASVVFVGQTPAWSGPALAVGSVLLTVTVISSATTPHGPVIRHSIVYVPLTRPEIVAFASVSEGVNEGAFGPPVTTHCPVLGAGLFPLKVAVARHVIISVPASTVTPPKSVVNVITSCKGGHGASVTCQAKVFVPSPSPVTVVEGLVGDVIVPDPLTRTHVPVPCVIALPESVASLSQVVRS